jgi:diaminopimelate epimerase
MNGESGVLCFTKYQALGNSYLFLDSSRFRLPSAYGIRKICDGNFGIGSDGLLYGSRVGEKKFSLRIFNPDGSEAEISGNGLRIFSRAMFELGQVTAGEKFFISTVKKNVECEIFPAEDFPAEEIAIDMGLPLFSDGNIPTFAKGSSLVVANGKEYEYYPVSLGNPHCVIFTDELIIDEVKISGRILEQNPMFPEKTNVEFAKIIDRSNILIEIWERGTGRTLACGSGACAVFAVANKLNLCADSARIQMPGGTLLLRLSPAGSIIQSGPASKIATCHVAGRYFHGSA